MSSHESVQRTHRGDEGKVGVDIVLVHHSRDGGCRCDFLRRDAHEIVNHLGGAGVRFSIMDKGGQGSLRVLKKGVVMIGKEIIKSLLTFARNLGLKFSP
jgi:hypothetical protein